MWPPPRWLTAVGCSLSALLFSDFFLDEKHLLVPEGSGEGEAVLPCCFHSSGIGCVEWKELTGFKVECLYLSVTLGASEELVCPAPPVGCLQFVLSLSLDVTFLAVEALKNVLTPFLQGHSGLNKKFHFCLWHWNKNHFTWTFWKFQNGSMRNM